MKLLPGQIVFNQLKKNLPKFLTCYITQNESFLKTNCFSYIDSHLNYVNTAWENTYQTKIKTVHYHQQ